MTRQRLSTATLGALTGALLFTGCGGGETAPSAEAPPFVFRSLELRQKKPTGDRDWDLTSPEARYEFNRRMIRARRPDAVLYTDNQPSFEIRADLATVLNDGALVLLEGAVEIQQLEGQRILIKGDRLRWTPALSLMVIEQGAEAVDTKARLLAETARFNQITQDLTMAGSVQLERWKQAFKGEASDAAEILVRSQRTVWNLRDGTLHADGPVYGERREDDDRILQQLHADRLQGNTQQGFVDFIGPVQVLSPDREGRLDAATTRWNYTDDTLNSNDPFQASMKKALLTGRGFVIDLQASSVNVLGDCKLVQPGDALKAERCAWNWTSDKVTAEGNVELRRDEKQQVTRSQRLEGTVANEGLVVFSSPGGSVQSELRIRDQGDGASTGPSHRSPVRF